MNPVETPPSVYRNRPLYLVSWALCACMAALAGYFLLVEGARDPWEVVLALAVPGIVAWIAVRVGILPGVAWDADRLTVRNPFVEYEAPLADTRLLGRSEKHGGALQLPGVGPVSPWALSRSVFDGTRANTARRDLRHAVLQAEATATTPTAPAIRRPVFGWYDLLPLPFLAAMVWAFLP
ncbi:hypothetical protein ABZX85_22605 [Streptomyces sp. NPDC004539]|uniref:hypothetical protein n=1 Tax=Streptomyces sp. NPDC004539 TaxID=3154280 RepID=UPI0033A1350F